MHRTGHCKCLNCGGFYKPEARSAGRQRYCWLPECRRASKQASQARWRGKPGNEDADDDKRRVREWRAAHPGYWKRKGAKRAVALRDSLKSQAPVKQQEVTQDGPVALRDLLNAQDPLLLGLVAYVVDSPLRETIAGAAQMLILRGRALKGECPGSPTYEKPNRDGDEGAACADPIQLGGSPACEEALCGASAGEQLGLVLGLGDGGK